MPRLNLNPPARPYTSSVTRVCQYCQKELNVKGHASHERACKARVELLQRCREYEMPLDASQSSCTPDINEVRDVEIRYANDHYTQNEFTGHEGHSEQRPEDNVSTNRSVHTQDESNNPSAPASRALENNVFEVDDIKVEFHPGSGLKPAVYHFQDYKREKSAYIISSEEEPWRPFVCRSDFDFARVAMEAALNAEQINILIKLIHSVSLGTRFTLSGDRELSKIWELAAKKLTPFKKEEITVPYKGKNRKYDVWFRPLWDWTLDLLKDNRVAPHIVWDAERVYKYDGSSFVRIFNEPWMGDRFWEIQSTMGHGKPFCWIIYADKNKLSSFGTEQGYPVIARCANLPIEIRNGKDLGSGKIIGWLPIVKDPPASRRKVSWTNHKRVVWHTAMRKILESIVELSKVGYWFDCADGIRRKIHPCILMLSADYEEQAFMTLIRGVNANFPCPKCLVPADQLANLLFTAKLRSQKDTMDLIDSLSSLTKAEAEKKLKAVGLRDVKNAFWDIENSDPHEAASWDRLHSYSTGVFGGHMWSDFKLLFEELGRAAEDQIDREFNMMPRFRNLHHFKEVMSIFFNDGSKFENLAKQLLFAAHNILTPKSSRHGYVLLQCLRVFLNLDTYLSFEVHTDETIEVGRNEMKRFSKLIAAYVKSVPATKNFTTNWDFIKMHLQKHAFDDVIAKGATRNFNTKPNEKLHKPLRDAYHLRTNYKDVAKQILRADHHLLVSALIQDKIRDMEEGVINLDEYSEEQRNVPGTDIPSRYSMGSADSKCSFTDFERLYADDVAFKDFRKKLEKHLNEYFLAFSVPLPDNKPIKIRPHDQIKQYKMLKINYESMVSWKQETDILRSNHNFHKHPRFDSIIFRTTDRYVFGRLISLTGYTIGDQEYHTALIQPCDAGVGRPRRKDIDLNLMRVKGKPRSSPEIISVHSIVRGAVLVPDYEKYNEFLVMDVVDTDMFMRVKEMRNATSSLFT